jgi:bacterioferritin-associated ferredoxin
MSSELRPRVVCRCLGVASPRIFEAVRKQGLMSVAAVTKALRAGGGCGLCHPEIEEILSEVRGEPFDNAIALENRLVCHQETLARIEGALTSLVAPRLIGLTLEGLHVRVRLADSADRELAHRIAETLRKYVCEDLEVEVEP